MNMKPLLAALLLIASGTSAAQTKGEPVTIAIHTNAVCDMCEKTIETELLYEKGVKAVDVDLEANMINVKIDPNKTDVEKVRTAITKLGYTADEMAPDMDAREKLPACCKKEGCGLPTAPATPEQKN